MGKGIQTGRDCELDGGGRDDLAEGATNWTEVGGCDSYFSLLILMKGAPLLSLFLLACCCRAGAATTRSTVPT